MYYIGIDPSMNNTAISVINEDLSFVKSYFFDERKKYGEFSKDHIYPNIYPKSQKAAGTDVFIQKITDLILKTFVGCADTDYKLLMEGYSYASTGKVFTIGEFTGVLKNKFLINNIQYSVVPPQTVKMFIHKGNDNKTELFAQFKLGKLYRELEDNNKGFCDSLSSFIDQFLCSLDNIKSPLSDILDSLYIALYLRHLSEGV